MTQVQMRIDEALDIAAQGRAYEACEKLWPMVRDDDTREQALFAIAHCFERANNLPTATYLYQWIVDHHPEFTAASRLLESCRARLITRGIHEDFSDSGHVDCHCARLRYRAELGICPYCGIHPAESSEEFRLHGPEGADPDSTTDSESGSTASPAEDIARQFDRTWSTVKEKFHEFTEREDLGEAGQRVQLLARELSERTQAVAETEKAKELRKRLEEVGEAAARRFRDFADTDAVRRTAQATKEFSEEAAARVKSTVDSDEIQHARQRLDAWTHDAADRVEAFAKGDTVRATGAKVINTLEGFVGYLQSYIDKAKGATTEPPAESDAEPIDSDSDGEE